ncbi:hypothetical protein DPQ33_12175 [Oceanidesulfovibrio indonesiensis]|uniref:Uncharacterized protein n=1 Tax=Oceanidesulfovibrio indonesiensis TaxID=54767 RepID=A0A7M3MDP3_9BACT|nr:hypothetical protein [Oceanidesulfovibrio indonesiensis]TVM16373.1 hypothetical protein DPQ33_12175 [Oceanidesulfovibrio indonesiensis]
MKSKAYALLNHQGANRLTRDLRSAVLAGVKEAGLRDRLLDEYRELAGGLRRLVAFAERYNLMESMTEEDRAAYAELMASFHHAGARGRILAEECRAADSVTYLATSLGESGPLQ